MTSLDNMPLYWARRVLQNFEEIPCRFNTLIIRTVKRTLMKKYGMKAIRTNIGFVLDRVEIRVPNPTYQIKAPKITIMSNTCRMRRVLPPPSICCTTDIVGAVPYCGYDSFIE